MNDAVEQFKDEIRDAGMEPPDVIEPGKIHRFPGIGKSRGNTSGWCILFEDGLGGCFGDWATGLKKPWRAKLDRKFSKSEQQVFTRNIEETRKRIAAEQKRRHADAAKKAVSIWESACMATDDHPYLLKKEIKANGARLLKDKLVIPVYWSGKIYSLQFIFPDGSKRFLSDGRTAGGYYYLGVPKNAKTVCIAEGFATGASIHQATGYPVIIAFSAYNLESVARAMQEKLSGMQIIICADDDFRKKGNPGIAEANKAARATGAKVVIPVFGDPRPEGATDFNDMAELVGLEAVTKAINAAKEPVKNSDADDNSWPELVPLNTPGLPRIDLAYLPGWAGDFACAIAADTETPLELAAGMVLITCATAATRCLRVMVQPGYFEPCNLWIVVALPPGNRKSAVQSAATTPLIDWERDRAADMEDEIKRKTSERKTMEARVKELRSKAARVKDDSEAEALAQKAAKIDAEMPEIPTPPHLWTSDATPERLGAMLAEHGECMAWLSSEGGIFDLLQGRYSNGIPNLDLVLKAHSGDPERVDRGSRPPVYLRSPRLSIGLSPQPDVLKGLASKPGFRGRGLLGRFLYLLPPSPLGYRTLKTTPIPETVRDAYVSEIRAMLDWELAIDEHGDEHPHLLRLSDEAWSEYHAFAQAIEMQMQPSGDFEHFTDWAGKAPGAAVRIAGVLHGIKHAHNRPWETPISGETMNDALEIMAVFSHHSLAALDMMGADPTVAAARHVWEWVERWRLSGFTVREAFNAHRGTFPRVQYLREALEVLVERGYIQVIKPSNEGRSGRPPSEVVLVRPDIQERWR